MIEHRVVKLPGLAGQPPRIFEVEARCEERPVRQFLATLYREEQPVSVIRERTLISRINRKLRHDGERLRKCRQERFRHDLGEFYIVNTDGHWIANKDVDIEDLGRDLGVLRPHEALVEEPATS